MFSYLSSFAQRRSDSARAQVQDELDAFTQQKLEEVQNIDRTLRNEVNTLWSNWRELARQDEANDIQSALASRSSRPASQTTSPRRRPETLATIRDSFDSIPPISPSVDRRPTPPAPTYGSLLTNTRALIPDHIANPPYQPSSRSRSPRQTPRRLDSSDSSHAITSKQAVTSSGSRSPLPISDSRKIRHQWCWSFG